MQRCHYLLCMIGIAFLLSLCVTGCDIRTVKQVRNIDSLSYEQIDKKTLQSKFPQLFKKDNPARVDTTKVSVVTVYTLLNNKNTSDSDILNRVDQFYYNTYDKFLSTLAILFTIMSIIIGIFGIYIPFNRSTIQKKQFDVFNEKLTKNEDALVSQSALVEASIHQLNGSLKKSEELEAKYNELNRRVDRIIEDTNRRSKQIKNRLNNIKDGLFLSENITDKDKEILEEYFINTSLLKNFGEQLESNDYSLRFLHFETNRLVDLAEKELPEWLAIDNSENPYKSMAQVYSTAGEIKKATEYFDKAVQINPDSYSSWIGKGNMYSSISEYEKAIECFDKAIQIKPDMFDAWFNKGLEYTRLHKYELALDYLNQAIKINPDIYDAWNSKGNVYSMLKDFEKSIEFYNKAIVINPENPTAWDNKGVAYGNLQQFDQALECYKKVIELSPSFVNAYYNLACVYSLSGQKQDMLINLKKSISLDSNNKLSAKEDHDFERFWNDPDFISLTT